MSIVIFAVWFAVVSFVGVRSARDISQEKLDHETVIDLIQQEKDMRAITGQEVPPCRP